MGEWVLEKGIRLNLTYTSNNNDIILPSELCELINAFTSQSASNFLSFALAIYRIEAPVDTRSTGSQTLNNVKFWCICVCVRCARIRPEQSNASKRQLAMKEQPVYITNSNQTSERASDWRCLCMALSIRPDENKRKLGYIRDSVNGPMYLFIRGVQSFTIKFIGNWWFEVQRKSGCK